MDPSVDGVTDRDGEAVCRRVCTRDDLPDGEGAPLTDAEMETVLERHRHLQLRETPPADRLRSWLAAMEETGRFADVDYDDRTRTDWEPLVALDRALGFLRAHHTSDGDGTTSAGAGADVNLDVGVGAEDLHAAALAALRYWFERDPESDNWYFNRIGAPTRFAKLLAVLGEDAPPAVRSSILAVLDRIEVDRVGANLVWLAKPVLVRECARRDGAEATETALAAIREVRIVADADEADDVWTGQIEWDWSRFRPSDGIRTDYGFTQHGPRLQQYAYGAGYVVDSVELAWLLRGTGAAYPPARLGLLADLLLEGHRWMQRGGHASPSTVGRGISRPGTLAVGDDLVRATRVLADLHGADGDGDAGDGDEGGEASAGHDRADTLRAFADHLAAGAPADAAPVAGHRHYWDADVAVHHRPGYFLSVKHVSDRTLPVQSHPETAAQPDNRKGEYLTSGAHFLTRRGDEYEGVFPVWDWTRVPGVTCRTDARRSPRPTAVAGGTSDGTCGVTAFDYRDGTVCARKLWVFGDSVACLGADITADPAPGGESVVTAIAQRPLAGTVTVGGPDGTEAFPAGEKRTLAATRLHHDGVGYGLPGSTPVTVSTRTRRGDWAEIGASEGTVERPVFGAWLDHGGAPDGEGYAYLLRPGVDAMEDGIPMTVLDNRAACQAVELPESGLLGAVLYDPGAFEAGDGTRIAADAPCVLQVRERGDDRRPLLAVSDPRGVADGLTVTLGDEAYSVSLADCPEGRRAGTTLPVDRAPLAPPG